MVSVSPESQAILKAARFEFDSFRRQELAFAVLNLFALAVLLLFHSLFSPLLGPPSQALLLFLGSAFTLRMLELLWLWARAIPLSNLAAQSVFWLSISLNLALALLLTFLTDREDSPYFVLLAFPVLQAAYWLSLPSCIGVVIISDAITFFWVRHFATFHPPVGVSEYFEAGVISLIYALMGLLVWFLVNQLRTEQTKTAHSFAELQHTREKLMAEEKLAAVGRLSSAVAHEVRNPVAIINSSLANAAREQLDEDERTEMYAIARSEAARLETLTTDFLAYARPMNLHKTLTSMPELLAYIADVARVKASEKDITVVVESADPLCAHVDREQVQRAILNLLLNGIDAAPRGGAVRLSHRIVPENGVEVQVENSGDPIPDEVLTHICEPFYTTKTHGTGLGLAISRNIAKSHGGDLRVLRNAPGHVSFALTLSDVESVEVGVNSYGTIVNS